MLPGLAHPAGIAIIKQMEKKATMNVFLATSYSFPNRSNIDLLTLIICNLRSTSQIIDLIDIIK